MTVTKHWVSLRGLRHQESRAAGDWGVGRLKSGSTSDSVKRSQRGAWLTWSTWCTTGALAEIEILAVQLTCIIHVSYIQQASYIHDVYNLHNARESMQCHAVPLKPAKQQP